MSIRRILQMEQPEDLKILKTRSTKVTQFDGELKRLVDDLFDTLRNADGVGLSAVQIGVLRRVLVMEMPGEYEEQEDGTVVELKPPKPYVLINPEIVQKSEETASLQEGCLSLPGRFADVPRSVWTVVRYRDLKGKQHKLRATDQLLSQCIQHEVDHVDGILFTERVVDITTMQDVRDKPKKKSRFRLPRNRRDAAGEVAKPASVGAE